MSKSARSNNLAVPFLFLELFKNFYIIIVMINASELLNKIRDDINAVRGYL